MDCYILFFIYLFLIIRLASLIVVQKNLGVHDNDIKKVKRKGGERELKRKENIFLQPPRPLSFYFTTFIARYDRMNMAFCAIHSKLRNSVEVIGYMFYKLI